VCLPWASSSDSSGMAMMVISSRLVWKLPNSLWSTVCVRDRQAR
jgi:hypothetical protein